MTSLLGMSEKSLRGSCKVDNICRVDEHLFFPSITLRKVLTLPFGYMTTDYGLDTECIAIAEPVTQTRVVFQEGDFVVRDDELRYFWYSPSSAAFPDGIVQYYSFGPVTHITGDAVKPKEDAILYGYNECFSPVEVD